MPTFIASPDIVRVVAEGSRLAHSYQFNPAFATETSLIDPLPHQRIAVYEHLLKQPRLRFLLADDAGAGKTIMTGLYIREMLARRLIRRVLVIPPAGLVGNWERELRTLFGLNFSILRGTNARNNNPFVDENSDQVIISVDTMASDRMFGRLKEAEVKPYDLVIFDEAHKLSADREPDFSIRKTDRYRLAEALAGVYAGDDYWRLAWNCQHLLLLTATPHMGKDFPYYCLWRLLEPEVLATYDAFQAYPRAARQRHFIRRTKEEMVRFDGSRIYPTRVSDTLSYELTQGDISEQALYDKTTDYIKFFYNRAKILNKSAARFAVSVFQRRLASSTYALLCSLRRRLETLEHLIEDVRQGKLTQRQIDDAQRKLEKEQNLFDSVTADEESAVDGQEENEQVEGRMLGAVIATSLVELEAERKRVSELYELAKQVDGRNEESKFEKLREVLRDPHFQNEKLIIFTEHRDTLHFLVQRLEGMGLAGQVAQIHGGMEFRERENQIEFFRKASGEGGARCLVATDAAGEGINLQFCWLMVNYDIPWNPARLEQRMGRIHRYKQTHDPVVIINLVAGNTREGAVMRTLLVKLEAIRRELGSDKVFDVVGKLFENLSLSQYMERLIDDGEERVAEEIEGKLTIEQVRALTAREKMLYGEGGEVQKALPRLRQDINQEVYRRLMPGYIRRFVENAAPLVGIQLKGDLDQCFTFANTQSESMDWLLPVWESYSPEQQKCLAVKRPSDTNSTIFLHPGQPLFDYLRNYVCEHFANDALTGGVFIDPATAHPYWFHLALVTVQRLADNVDSGIEAEKSTTMVEVRLVGLRQDIEGRIVEIPVEHLLLLNGAHGVPVHFVNYVKDAGIACERARVNAIDQVAANLVAQHRKTIVESLPEREDFIKRGFDLQEAELADRRRRYTEKAMAGDARAKGEVTRIKKEQNELTQRRENALMSLHREPNLIISGEINFVAHALVLPSSDPTEQRQYFAQTESIAMHVARAYEEANGAMLRDVSKPELARMANLGDWPGFDLLSHRPDGEDRAIEVKGRAGMGEIEMKENEWAKACNLRERYWLYVVYHCDSAHPRLLRIQDPFGKLIARNKGSVIIGQSDILQAAE